MGFFQGLQNSAFTDWFLGSPSIWAYPTVLTLHGIGMAMLVGASVVLDLRLLRVGAAIPLISLRPLYRVVWLGFAINLASGLVLFVTEAGDRVADPLFYTKLGCIALALWVGVAAKRRFVTSGDAGVGATVWRDRLLAVASLTLWTMAIVSGRLMAYLHP
jgi:hypothetical protein